MKETRQPLEVYLAAKFSMKEEVKQRAEELSAVGIGCTSRWLLEEASSNSDLDGTPEAAAYYEKHAKIDINDIYDSDAVVLFTIDPLEAAKRGGRHFEAGYAAALQHTFGADQLRLITVGPKENIFHFLPEFLNFPTWEEAKAYLIALREDIVNGQKGSSESVGEAGQEEDAPIQAS